MGRYFTEEDEAVLRRWWKNNRLRGSRSFESHNEEGEPDTLRVEVTLRPPLPRWVQAFAGPPPTDHMRMR